MKNQLQQRNKRRTRIRSKISGTAARPRLSVFRSNTQIWAQIIDDEKQVTLASFSTKNIKDAKLNKSEKSFQVGEELAKLAKAKKITAVVFDRGGYQYHGRVAKVAEGARKGGLEL
jgi:large subunit ribosomal protein L18